MVAYKVVCRYAFMHLCVLYVHWSAFFLFLSNLCLLGLHSSWYAGAAYKLYISYCLYFHYVELQTINLNTAGTAGFSLTMYICLPSFLPEPGLGALLNSYHEGTLCKFHRQIDRLLQCNIFFSNFFSFEKS